MVVILVTRLNGPVFALNPDLIERADCTPDTVITLVDGTKYVISESLAELIELIRQYRASVIAQAEHRVREAEYVETERPIRDGETSAKIVRLHPRER
jgi:flagellar protein FlbD